MSADSSSILSIRSAPGVRDGFEIFTRALEAGLTRSQALDLAHPQGRKSVDGFVGALFAAVAILDRAAACGARPNFKGDVAGALALPFMLRGKARVAALEQLPKDKQAAVMGAMLDVAAVYAAWLMKREGELPRDPEERLQGGDGFPGPPASSRARWPGKPMDMRRVTQFAVQVK